MGDERDAWQQALTDRAAGHNPPNQTAHTGKTDDQASTEQDRANVNTDHHSQG